jgi:hypothetical protein
LKAVTRKGSSPYDFSPCDFIASVTRNERSNGGGGADPKAGKGVEKALVG